MKQSGKVIITIAVSVGCLTVGVGLGVGIYKIAQTKQVASNSVVKQKKKTSKIKDSYKKIKKEEEPEVGEVTNAITGEVEQADANTIYKVTKEELIANNAEGIYDDIYAKDEYRLAKERLNDPDNYVLSTSQFYLLSEEDILGFDADLLDFARNEIYARYGYNFQKDTYSNHFSSKSWYMPCSDNSQVKLSDIEKLMLTFLTGRQSF